jgi:hypothetical protein
VKVRDRMVEELLLREVWIYFLHGQFNALIECEWSGCLVLHWQHGVLAPGHCPTTRPFVKPMQHVCI